jgi:hypothetical protein
MTPGQGTRPILVAGGLERVLGNGVWLRDLVLAHALCGALSGLQNEPGAFGHVYAKGWPRMIELLRPRDALRTRQKDQGQTPALALCRPSQVDPRSRSRLGEARPPLPGGDELHSAGIDGGARPQAGAALFRLAPGEGQGGGDQQHHHDGGAFQRGRGLPGGGDQQHQHDGGASQRRRGLHGHRHEQTAALGPLAVLEWPRPLLHRECRGAVSQPRLKFAHCGPGHDIVSPLTGVHCGSLQIHYIQIFWFVMFFLLYLFRCGVRWPLITALSAYVPLYAVPFQRLGGCPWPFKQLLAHRPFWKYLQRHLQLRVRSLCPVSRHASSRVEPNRPSQVGPPMRGIGICVSCRIYPNRHVRVDPSVGLTCVSLRISIINQIAIDTHEWTPNARV